jgi:predicted aconitase with swiveling domain
MKKIILKGHKGIGGTAEGEALVSNNALSYIFDVGGIWENPMSARVTNKIEMPDWYGQDLANKVLLRTGVGITWAVILPGEHWSLLFWSKALAVKGYKGW